MNTGTTLIIGGASGMGLATAQRRAAQGDALWLVGRSASKLGSAAASLRQAGASSVRTTAADITDMDALARLISEIDAEPGHIARLVNAAGTFVPKPFLDHDADDIDHYRKMMDGAIALARMVLMFTSVHLTTATRLQSQVKSARMRVTMLAKWLTTFI